MRRIHARFLVKIIELRARIEKTNLKNLKKSKTFYFYMSPVLFVLEFVTRGHLSPTV